MSLGAKKSSSKQQAQSGLNPFGQLAGRAILARLLGGQESYDALGIGTLHGGDPGNAAPESGYGDISGILPSKEQEMQKLNTLRNALRGGFSDYENREYAIPPGAGRGGR